MKPGLYVLSINCTQHKGLLLCNLFELGDPFRGTDHFIGYGVPFLVLRRCDIEMYPGVPSHAVEVLVENGSGYALEAWFEGTELEFVG